MTTDPAKRLAEIREREGKATKGKWEIEDADFNVIGRPHNIVGSTEWLDGGGFISRPVCFVEDSDDAKFLQACAGAVARSILACWKSPSRADA